RITERGAGVRVQEQRVDVFRVLRQQRSRPCLRVIEATAKQENLDRLDLRVAIVGQGIRRSNELGKSGAQVVHPLVGLSQLPPRLAELRIEANGARIFDDGKLVALLCGVLVSALVVTLFLDLGTAAGDGQSG